MRKFTILLMVLTLVLLSNFAVVAEENIEVGFIATNFSSEAQGRVAQGFRSYVEDQDWDIVELNSRGSIDEQSSQLENLVQMDVDAIVMAMGHPAEIKSAVQKVLDANIPLITIDSGYVDGVVTDITTNNFVMGAKISSYLVDSLGGKGNIIVIKFHKHYGTRRRGKVLDVVLSEYPEIKVLDEYGVSATKRFMEDTRSAMETFALKHGDEIDGVWCAFDQLAYVSADVLEEQGIDTKVVGVDGNEETFRRIESGNMAATVAQPFEEMAKAAGNIIKEMVVEGKSKEEVAPNETMYIDAPLINKNNLPE